MDTKNHQDPKEEPKEWTIMVYMAGGRDVSDEARDSLLRMKLIGTTDNFNVIAQFDSGIEGDSTKIYKLMPFENAEKIRGLLKRAYFEAPTSSDLFNSTVMALSYENSQSLLDALDIEMKKRLEDKLLNREEIEKLKIGPNRMKKLVVDSILEGDVIKDDLGQTDAANPNVLKDFIDWTMRKYPAKKKMVVIWGHGSGLSIAWDFPPRYAPSIVTYAPDALTLHGLGQAFKDLECGTIDILGFNSCLMGTIDVSYELRVPVTYCVASEGLTPRTSWPYHRILEELGDTPDMDAETFAHKIVEEYISYYRHSVTQTESQRRKTIGLGKVVDLGKSVDLGKVVDLGKSVDLGKVVDLGKSVDLAKVFNLGPEEELGRKGIDMSAFNVKESNKVVDAMVPLVKLLRQKLQYLDRATFAAVLAAHAASQSYFNRDFTDLSDFCRTLSNSSSDTEIQTLCHGVMKAIEKSCPCSKHVGDDVKNSKGLSVFFPWGEWGDLKVLEKYRHGMLEFTKETHWESFLETYRGLVYQLEEKSGHFADAFSQPA